jgi:hypothetical protein
LPFNQYQPGFRITDVALEAAGSAHEGVRGVLMNDFGTVNWIPVVGPTIAVANSSKVSFRTRLDEPVGPRSRPG